MKFSQLPVLAAFFLDHSVLSTSAVILVIGLLTVAFSWRSRRSRIRDRHWKKRGKSSSLADPTAAGQQAEAPFLIVRNPTEPEL